MKAVSGILIIALFVVVLGVWWLSDEPSPQETNVQSELPSTAPEQVTVRESIGIEAARQRVANAKLALQATVVEREKVEAQLAQAERDVTELERFIEEIEARGEDPVDYADEGLEMFQPAFYAYQQAFEQLELVESMHEAAQEEVAAAEQQLAELLAESDLD